MSSTSSQLSQPDSERHVLETFLPAYNPTRGLEIYGESSRLPDHQNRQQSDFSVTTRSSRVYDYGMGSRSIYRRQMPAGITQSEGITTQSGKWSDAEPPSRDTGDIDADLANLSLDDSDAEVIPMETLLHEATLDAKQGAGGKEWLPVSALDRICKRSTVRRELRTIFPAPTAESYSKYICGTAEGILNEEESCQRIFCILVLIGKVSKLPAFINAELKDKHLPFLWIDNTSRKSLCSPSSNYKDTALPCFGKNDVAVMKPFYQAQWQIQIPFIGRDSDDEVKEYQIHRDAIMPWTMFAGREKESGYSQVRQVEIHEAHHTFHKHKTFALKTLHQNDPIRAAQEFKSELRIFRKMKPEKHLLELCATFKTEMEKADHEYSFLFPWADGGSLETLWKKQPPMMIPGRTVTPRLFLNWIAEQCHGLAAALRSMHDLRLQALKKTNLEDRKREEDKEHYGIHGDIKPENILHFSQLVDESPTGLGVLKIADFGLTEFHTLRSRTREALDWNKPTPAPTHRAPELVVPGEYFSRKADVWSLGCVFSQFITWAALGGDSVREFDNRRLEERDFDHKKHASKFKSDAFFKAEYFANGEVKTSLKEKTKQWLDDLYPLIQKDKERNFLTDFLDLITYSMLESQRQKRIGCEEIVEKLAQFVTRSEMDNSPDDPYWNPPLPSFEQHSPAGGSSSSNIPEIRVNDSGLTRKSSTKRAKNRVAPSKVSFQAESRIY